MIYYTHMDSKIQKEVGKKIKAVREKNDLTQAEVATKADMNVNYYARIERGEENPSLDILQRIIKALKVKSSEILPF
jgi:XRE family transcriptional regulator, regulator of sulfur utilization